MTLVSCDPGLRVLGLGMFKDGVLRSAALVEGAATGGGAGAWLEIARNAREAVKLLDWDAGWKPGGVDLFVHEQMQVYGPRGQKGDQADLLELAGVAGAVAAYLDPGHAHSYVPREWKGQTPKSVHNKRVLAALTPAERKALDAVECPPSLLHNVIDAVGIGLFQLGRIRGTVSPR